MTKPNGKFYSEDFKISAADVGISSKSESGDAKLSIVAHGSKNDGNISISSNGGSQIVAGNAVLAVGSKSEGSAALDAGPTGTAVVSAGNPAVPQTITLDGGEAKIQILNGAIPICPVIELTPESIKLSVGPTSSIEITPEGVTIEGLMLNLKGTAEANVSGAMVNVKGSGMTAIAGGLITIG